MFEDSELGSKEAIEGFKMTNPYMRAPTGIEDILVRFRA
jgi:hypothetical protein